MSQDTSSRFSVGGIPQDTSAGLPLGNNPFDMSPLPSVTPEPVFRQSPQEAPFGSQLPRNSSEFSFANAEMYKMDNLNRLRTAELRYEWLVRLQMELKSAQSSMADKNFQAFLERLRNTAGLHDWQKSLLKDYSLEKSQNTRTHLKKLIDVGLREPTQDDQSKLKIMDEMAVLRQSQDWLKKVETDLADAKKYGAEQLLLNMLREVPSRDEWSDAVIDKLFSMQDLNRAGLELQSQKAELEKLVHRPGPAYLAETTYDARSNRRWGLALVSVFALGSFAFTTLRYRSAANGPLLGT
eukprot:gnl/TRDRNA2_/TRDRNA2_133075_c1_seq1.p1 gnl/TRDRNA2_/TRDRNA2_133075_c1~~gnl/TRDRNA2_/TRDRNA2_133075_c1_seq1.p1  ORF type:complete len:320 (+),score=51.89 gnl/TRDRNA2_/TRDRNA2_133075_c1_seq1:74-961(+)